MKNTKMKKTSFHDEQVGRYIGHAMYTNKIESKITGREFEVIGKLFRQPKDVQEGFVNLFDVFIDADKQEQSLFDYIKSEFIGDWNKEADVIRNSTLSFRGNERAEFIEKIRAGYKYTDILIKKFTKQEQKALDCVVAIYIEFCCLWMENTTTNNRPDFELFEGDGLLEWMLHYLRHMGQSGEVNF